MTSAPPIIEIAGLVKRFGDHTVLDGVDLEVDRGDVVVVIGPSGSGKTTLLRCVNHLESYEAGSLKLDGVEVGYRDGPQAQHRRRRSDRELALLRSEVGMVFQSFNLFPHLSALRNVTLGLVKVRGMAKDEARAIAVQWLTRVGLGDKVDALPAQLSGGQMQRVGIARAVAANPKVLLLDEITSALDPELVSEVLDVVSQLASDGMTMVAVTHEMSFAHDVATRVVFMDEGHILCQGAPHEMLVTPRNERLQAFLARFHMGLATSAAADRGRGAFAAGADP
jgi:polar amino acid transport system ATP-binding protein